MSGAQATTIQSPLQDAVQRIVDFDASGAATTQPKSVASSSATEDVNVPTAGVATLPLHHRTCRSADH